MRPVAGWMARAVAMSLILSLAGCREQGALPRGVEQSGTAITITPAWENPLSSNDSISSITLALLGDVMLGRDVRLTSETFAYLEPYLSSADLALASLESPLTDSPTETESPYALCAPPGNVRYLAEAGFDLLSISNNHILDCGTKGLAQTKTTLTEAGLGFIGPEAGPVYRSIRDIPLAFLAFDATTDRFDLESAARAVGLARDGGAIALVSVHWGAEYQTGASNGQKAIARQLAAAGAALIWGHHPHVLQSSEWIGDGRTLVLYSLGNALFDQYGLDSTRQSALVLVTLDLEGVVQFKAIPFSINVRESRIVEAGQTDAQIIMQHFR